MKSILCIVGWAVLALLLSAPAFADAPACYTYDCSTGLTCTFNASCTTTSPIWRVWYDFGDGGTSGHVAPTTTVSHTYLDYDDGGPAFPLVKLTVIPFSGPILTVTCNMPINQVFGPPMTPTGTCE